MLSRIGCSLRNSRNQDYLKRQENNNTQLSEQSILHLVISILLLLKRADTVFFSKTAAGWNGRQTTSVSTTQQHAEPMNIHRAPQSSLWDVSTSSAGFQSFKEQEMRIPGVWPRSRSLRKGMLLPEANSWRAPLQAEPSFCHCHRRGCLFLLLRLSCKPCSSSFALPYSTHFQLVNVWKGAVWPAFRLLPAPALQKKTWFLFSFCRSTPADVVQFVILDVSETLPTPHPPTPFFLATLSFMIFFMVVLAFLWVSALGFFLACVSSLLSLFYSFHITCCVCLIHILYHVSQLLTMQFTSRQKLRSNSCGSSIFIQNDTALFVFACSCIIPSSTPPGPISATCLIIAIFSPSHSSPQTFSISLSIFLSLLLSVPFLRVALHISLLESQNH